MAVYTYNFEDATVGTPGAVAGWTVRPGADGTFTTDVLADGNMPAGMGAKAVRLRHTNFFSSTGFLTVNAAGAAVGDFDIAALVRADTLVNDGHEGILAGRIGTTAGSTQQFMGAGTRLATIATVVQLAVRRNWAAPTSSGTHGNLASFPGTGMWVWVRHRQVGAVSSIKAWLFGDLEPTEWMQADPHPPVGTIPAAGYVGYGFSFSGSNRYTPWMAYYSVATAGDVPDIPDPPITYRVQRNGEIHVAGLVNPTHTVFNVSPGETFRVQARFASVDGEWSDVYTVPSAEPPTEAPVLSLNFKTDTVINFSWTAVPNATFYEVYRKLASAGDETYVLIQDNTQLTRNDTGRTPGTAYTYRVRGYTSNDYGPYGYLTETTDSDDDTEPVAADDLAIDVADSVTELLVFVSASDTLAVGITDAVSPLQVELVAADTLAVGVEEPTPSVEDAVATFTWTVATRSQSGGVSPYAAERWFTIAPEPPPGGLALASRIVLNGQDALRAELNGKVVWEAPT